MTLAEIAPGTPTTVVRIAAAGALGDRLMEMGMTPGASVRVLRAGDPLQIEVRGYRLGLRRSDAADIEVSA